MNKRKLMILGAGRHQVPIIKQAQKMGFETIAVSIPGDYPGFSIADKSCEIDVREKEKILEIARQERICGILTDQTDIPVPTVAYVAEQMGLPGIGYDCALRFTNKYKMRRFCEQNGIPVPRYLHASSTEEAREKGKQFGFPLVVKPVDNQGSRGVARVNHPDELEEKFQKAIAYSSCNFAILEEFIPGVEVVVQGFASNFNFSNLVIGDRVYFDLPNLFIPKQTMFPSLLREELKQKILDLNYRLITSFAPRFGVTHSEYIVNEETGEIRLVETAIRGGGVFISSDLVPLACGVNVLELLINIASGKANVKINRSKPHNGACGYVCFCLPEGVIRRVNGMDEIISLPGVHKAYSQHEEVGKRTSQMTDKSNRLGPILIAGKDRQALQETIRTVQKTLQVEVETSNGIRGIEW